MLSASFQVETVGDRWVDGLIFQTQESTASLLPKLLALKLGVVRSLSCGNHAAVEDIDDIRISICDPGARRGRILATGKTLSLELAETTIEVLLAALVQLHLFDIVPPPIDCELATDDLTAEGAMVDASFGLSDRTMQCMPGSAATAELRAMREKK